MTTIKICDGKSEIEVQVEDSFALTYAEIEHRDSLTERKETRRHQSLNASMDNGFDFPDKTVNIEEDAIKSEEESELHKVIAKLLPEQQELIRKVYFEKTSITDIAKEYGVDKTSIRDRLKTIYKKIKSFL